MIALDWAAFGIGGAAGIAMSVVFFAGLALGMRRALQGGHAVRTLAISAALRISALLGAGWLVATHVGPWGFAGYGLAFFLCRHIATVIARAPQPEGSPK
ncbi:ATP synthase subunit AtpR [Aliishimia ponticola]|uniref:ATP synthase subunit AtpR n=1 Tax=Aliishimia ponticola TaxID=2499833 RepID=A0A4S4NFL1_9RHOB|nr:ATP synthase subunit AtpR [Aliishimia ponticola]THH36911.1 ATP synthase subunit AtpR [Aliishimia ponticola]